MSDEESKANTEQQPSEIEKIKADMMKEFDEFKQSMSKELEARDAKIKELTEANDGLRASLVRNTFTQPAPEKHEPTKEELYQAEVKKWADRTNDLMKQELTRC